MMLDHHSIRVVIRIHIKGVSVMEKPKYPSLLQHVINVAEENCKSDDLTESVLVPDGENINLVIVLTPTREDLLQHEPMKELDRRHHLPAEEWITDNMIIEAKYAILRDFLIDFNPDEYVHMLEGWATTFTEAYKRYSRISDMPPEDREDVAMVNYYQRGGKPIHLQSIIDTHADGTRSIREWKELEEASGRAMVNIYE